MKTPTNDLFRIVSSMTAAEKRYLKRHYLSDKGHISKLFYFLNGLDSYDEELVKKQFSSLKLAKNLKVYKVHLKNLIVKSLISYHSKRNAKSSIRLGLEEIDILQAKHLHEIALKKLEKIKQLCIQHDEDELYLSVLTYEQKMKFHLKNNKSYNIENKLKVIESLKDNLDYEHLIDHLVKLSFEKIIPQKDIDFFTQQLEQNLELLSNTDLSLKKRISIIQFTALIYRIILMDWEKEYLQRKELISLIEKSKGFIKEHVVLYWDSLFLLNETCFILDKNEEQAHLTKELSTLIERHPILYKNRLLLYHFEIKNNYNQGSFDEITKSLELEAFEFIQENDLSEDQIAIEIYFYLALIHTRLNDVSKTQFYLRRLYPMAKKLGKGYTQFFEILELISHYNADDVDIVQYSLQSYYRKIRRNNNFTPFFCSILNFFKALLKVELKDKKELVVAFEKKLVEFKEDEVFETTNQYILVDWLNALKNNGQTNFSKAKIISLPSFSKRVKNFSNF